MPTVSTICHYLERFAPSSLAAEWDNVGLLLGDRATEVQRILTCLTVTSEVGDEAIENGAQLIVAHHPILFRGTKRLTADTVEGRILWPLARAGVAVYSPHTAFDNTHGGINDFLARRLGLVKITPLRKQLASPSCKVVVFVPDVDLQRVSDAMFAAGAGEIGNYSQCSFRLAGTGTFFGSDETNPTVGRKGQREEVAETRLEVICPKPLLAGVLAAMRKTHSYEEPAFDVYNLEALPGKSGEGRLARLDPPIALKEFARRVKETLNIQAVPYIGDADRAVEIVALACGAAGEFLSDAVRDRADVFLTGEMRFHDYLKAKSQGVALVLPGHYATERPAVERLADLLAEEFEGLKVWASRRESDPVNWA